ncbi:hypothetical protein C1H46_002663 [Malus baccata]|uniref:DUF4283 domain-containing protein n=1 Tax=Malus baccata TaxID=106549 RepID=A0A540NLB0_MALBA|nr:hypothetical protein C1H46_002663 [Malus baccata]
MFQVRQTFFQFLSLLWLRRLLIPSPCDMVAINKMVVWTKLPCVLVQYKEVVIIKVIAQPLCDIIRVDEVTLGLSGLFMKVFIEVDLRFPLKRVLIVRQDDDKLILISYEKLF